VLAPLAGAVNNDNAAFAGGAIATLAALQLLVTGSRAWLLAALGGVIVASWAKFTGLLLAGGLVAGVLLWLAQAAGWDSADRLGPAAFARHFVSEFVLEWMPTLKPRNALNYAALAIPITAALCAFAGILVALRRIAYRKEDPLDVVTAAGALAFAATFVLHGIFSYQLHTEFGWLTTAYPRYYLPLAALVPLAGLSLLGAIKQPSAHTILLVFLIAGPVVFRLLGAPLG
jgi:hypothetical protein